MKIMAQLAVIGALVAGATALNAQTNIDLNVNISLTGVVQTGDTATRGKIATKDVIQAAAPGSTAKAKLLLRFSPDGSDPVFVVRDGSTDTVIDTGTLSTGSAGNSVTTTTSKGDVNTTRTAEIRGFTLSTDTINFNVQGYATSSANNAGLHGEVFDNASVVSLSAKVA